MSLSALRDTIDLLVARPVLWVPGAACGILGAAIWLVLALSGAFFAGRLFVFALLASIIFLTGIHVAIKKDSPDIGDMFRGSASYYFRVLTPTLVIVSGIILVYLLVILTLTLFGMLPDAGFLTFLTFGVVIPTIMLTFFYDTAAVFEDRKVFESIQRSIDVVTANLFEVVLFYLGCFIICSTIAFACLVAWTAMLADKLEPITHYTEAQIAEFMPDQFMALIGQDGIWISAACLFVAITIIATILVTYKACFFRTISKTTVPIQQTIGEYDSKGRWYKY
jgi:hypothetical protein